MPLDGLLLRWLNRSVELKDYHVVFDMPLPTSMSFRFNGDIKRINHDRVKFECNTGAEEYFCSVCEKINGIVHDVGDIKCVDSDDAERELFFDRFTSQIPSCIWNGTMQNTEYLDSFVRNGLIDTLDESKFIGIDFNADDTLQVLEQIIGGASDELLLMENDEKRIYLSSDIYKRATIGLGLKEFRGIPFVDCGENKECSFGVFTIRNNIAVSFHGSSFPNTELRMWYNPDEMENRQRIVFMIGTVFLDENLLSYVKISK